jgi:hypothetical protein
VAFAEQLCGATGSYWSRFIDARYEVITETKTTLSRFIGPDARNGFVSSAIDSLTAAESQLGTITPDRCVNFVNAWQDDRTEWQRFSNAVNNVGSIQAAMEFLELKSWTQAEFGAVIDFDEQPTVSSPVD